MLLLPSKIKSFFLIFFCLKLFVNFIILIEHVLIFSTNMPLIIVFQSSTNIPLTIINKGVLANNKYFTIKINTINQFLNNRTQTRHLI